MKNFIKILSILMVLSMLATVFAACTDKTETPDTDNGTTDTDGTTDTQPGDDEANNGEVIKILNLDSFLLLVDAINKDPSQSVGKTYKLMINIDIYPGWDATPSEKLGKFVAPDAVTEFAGINEFYGTFDGNGKTITSVYMADSAEADGNVAIFKKLNGGTIKNLTVNTAFIYDDGAKGATVSGLVGTVTGDNSVIENVTVNSNVFVASNADATVAGVVGKVAAENLTVKDVTFGGRVGVIGTDLSINSPSTTAVLGQMIADGGDKTITMSRCKANGAINAGAETTTDAFCAKGSAKLTKTDCTITAPTGDGSVENSVVEIYTVEEFKTLATLGSNFEGKTVRLMRDIILNEGWTAGTTAPTDVWGGIAEFKGELDGNGKIISGLYGENFIGTLSGTVKNFMLLNSAFVSADDANVGFIGTVNGGTVKDVYSEADVYYTGSADAKVGGIAGNVTGASTFENVVFAGAIEANGKTADLIANGTATCKNVLAVGTGATTSATGTCVLAEKKDATFLDGNTAYADWSYSAYLASVAPTTVAELLRFLQLTPDTSWYNETDTVFEIYTAEQFLGISVLGQTNTFEGKTIKLMANINLNPTWDASSSVSSAGVVTMASAPNNVWTSIPVFKGTLDGNGYCVKGIYSSNNFTVPGSGVRAVGGFINELTGGCIKNLIVKNSFSFFESTTGKNGTTRIHVGGFIGHVVDASLITLYVDMDAWVRFDYHFNFGGMISALGTKNETYVGTIKDIVFAGTSGVVPTDSNVCTDAAKRSDNMRYGGVIAANMSWDNSKNIGVTMENVAFTGAAYKPTSKASGDEILCYTSGGAYNNGIGIDNAGFYHNAFAWNPATEAPEYSPTTADSVADNVLNNKGSVGVADDTYAAAGWKSVNAEDNEAYANGAGLETILLPGSVVDMLLANNG